MNYNFDNKSEPVQIFAIDSITLYQLVKQATDKLLSQQKEKKQWLSASECMNLLNIRRTTLCKLRQTGAISYAKFGRKILYSAESVEQYLLENTQEKF
ncbi:helix-turn-helix domain-containing protein [Chryseobacterium sp. EO14]|uniref:helix-turn-helix domain-containing protein n=1 Tax=Chryseobacterium sp. EO14 TaxID=2950551 RepID=UPI00210C4080|nr:helix-turn-helix domain-containing protein [Chryseobacterium sp. EO14]MCQ4140602.1 helix-turn-helix domain-containing protein [Chryseobacterium sp. EO14]